MSNILVNFQYWESVIIQYSPYLLLLAFLFLAWTVMKFVRSTEPVPTIQVLGYDPASRQFELREIEKQGDTAVWEREEGEDIRFKPVSQTIHSHPEGPAWFLDLTDGRTMYLTESDETIRTTGKELEMAKKDTTVEQAMNTEPSEMAFYVKLALIAAPVMILLLIVIAFGVFTGA